MVPCGERGRSSGGSAREEGEMKGSGQASEEGEGSSRRTLPRPFVEGSGS